MLEPAGWQAGREAFKSGKSWKCGEGEEVRATKEKVSASSLHIFYVPNEYLRVLNINRKVKTHLASEVLNKMRLFLNRYFLKISSFWSKGTLEFPEGRLPGGVEETCAARSGRTGFASCFCHLQLWDLG